MKGKKIVQHDNIDYAINAINEIKVSTRNDRE